MITSNQNPKIKHIRRLLSDRRFRHRQRAFVVEGTRWLAELVQAGRRPDLVLVTTSWLDDVEHRRLLDQLDVTSTVADDNVLAAASATETPGGVLAVAPMIDRPLPAQPSLLLILDRVADPGNLGTILRTAAAAGVDGVFLSPGCVDPYNPKAVRATMGALLRLPVLTRPWEAIRDATAEFAVWLAAAGGPLLYSDVDWRQSAALVIGSEASGVGPEASALGGERISVPMAAQTESLNAAAAAAAILFEASRQRCMGNVGRADA